MVCLVACCMCVAQLIQFLAVARRVAAAAVAAAFASFRLCNSRRECAHLAEKPDRSEIARTAIGKLAVLRRENWRNLRPCLTLYRGCEV